MTVFVAGASRVITLQVVAALVPLRVEGGPHDSVAFTSFVHDPQPLGYRRYFEHLGPNSPKMHCESGSISPPARWTRAAR